MFYSKTTSGFYTREIHGDNIPADAVEITKEEHLALINGQSQGKRIVADASGRPLLQDPPPPTIEQIIAPAPPEEAPEIPEHIPTIEDLRHEAWEAVNAWRLREEQKDIVFDFDGRQWDGGWTTRQRLQPVLSLPELPEGFFWTDHHNNDVPVTAETLQQLNAAHEDALVAEGFRIHVTQRQLKELIAGMDREELDQFDITQYAN